MLVAKRPLVKAVLARSRIYELIEDGRSVGSIEHGPHRDLVDVNERRYFIVPQRKATLFETAVKHLFWLWKESYVFRESSGTIVATAEKNAVDEFFLRYEGATYSVRPPRGFSFDRGVEVCKQGERAVIGEIQYKGVAGLELVSTLPKSWSLPVRALVMWMLVFRIANARRND